MCISARPDPARLGPGRAGPQIFTHMVGPGRVRNFSNSSLYHSVLEIFRTPACTIEERCERHSQLLEADGKRFIFHVSPWSLARCFALWPAVKIFFIFFHFSSFFWFRAGPGWAANFHSYGRAGPCKKFFELQPVPFRVRNISNSSLYH